MIEQVHKNNANNNTYSTIPTTTTTTNNLLNNLQEIKNTSLLIDISLEEINQIFSKIKTMNLEKDRYSKGSEGLIFKISLKDEKGNLKEYIVAKKRYDNNPYKEREMHKKVQDLINEKLPHSLVKVPKLKALLKTSETENFIIMEFIHGKTLYQIELEEIFKKWNIPTGHFENDSQIESAFFKILQLNPSNPNDQKKAEQKYYEEIKNMKLFSPQEGQKYKKALEIFLQTLHQHNIYHRDISSRNIMISPQGEIYVIDFGKSVCIDHGAIKNIYEQQEGEKIGVYINDDSIIGKFVGYTKSEEDLENESFQKEILQKTKDIESDNSVFEYLQEIPTGWIPKNKIPLFLEKVKKQSILSKKISLFELESCKNKENFFVLLLAQSKKNIDTLINEIEYKKKNIENEILKEKRKQEQIPLYLLKSNDKEGIESHKKHYDHIIQKIQKKMDKIQNIENYVLYLKNALK